MLGIIKWNVCDKGYTIKARSGNVKVYIAADKMRTTLKGEFASSEWALK